LVGESSSVVVVWDLPLAESLSKDCLDQVQEVFVLQLCWCPIAIFQPFSLKEM